MSEEQSKGSRNWAVGVIANPAAVVIGKTLILSAEGLVTYLQMMQAANASTEFLTKVTVGGDPDPEKEIAGVVNAYYNAKEQQDPNFDAPAQHLVSTAEGEAVEVNSQAIPRRPLRATANPEIIKGGARITGTNLPYREPSKVPEYIAEILRGKALKAKEINERLAREPYNQVVKPGTLTYFLKVAQERHGVQKLGVGMYGAPVHKKEEQ